MVECTVWWATALTETAEFRGMLDPAELERFAAYRTDADRRRFLTGRTLAKLVIAAQLELPAERIEFDASCTDCGKQHGPPRLAGTDLVFSIAHSDERVGLAVTRGSPVGLDVEATSRNVTDGLLSYTLNRTELAALEGMSQPARAEAFFTSWVHKEALLKATGRGLRLPLRSLTLAGPNWSPQLVDSSDAMLSPDSTRLAACSPGAGYAAAVAALETSELTVQEYWWSPESGFG